MQSGVSCITLWRYRRSGRVQVWRNVLSTRLRLRNGSRLRNVSGRSCLWNVSALRRVARLRCRSILRDIARLVAIANRRDITCLGNIPALRRVGRLRDSSALRDIARLVAIANRRHRSRLRHIPALRRVGWLRRRSILRDIARLVADGIALRILNRN